EVSLWCEQREMSPAPTKVTEPGGATLARAGTLGWVSDPDPAFSRQVLMAIAPATTSATGTRKRGPVTRIWWRRGIRLGVARSFTHALQHLVCTHRQSGTSYLRAWCCVDASPQERGTSVVVVPHLRGYPAACWPSVSPGRVVRPPRVAPPVDPSPAAEPGTW